MEVTRKFSSILILILFGLGAIQAEIPISIAKGLQKCYDKGGLSGVVNCAGLKTLNTVAQLSNKESLEIMPGIVLVRNEGEVSAEKPFNEDELPANPTNQSEKIFELLSNATMKLISERTLMVKLPKINSESSPSELDEEGRARKRKGNKFGNFGGIMGPFMVSMGVKLLALIGGVGFLSAKALVTAKLALVVSAILFFQYYLSRGGGSVIPPYYGGGGGSYYPSVTYGTNNIGGWNPQYPYARSLEVSQQSTENYEGEQVAYSSYSSNYQQH